MRDRRLKVAFYTVKGSRNQAARWSYWARRAGFPSVGRWLEDVADAAIRRLETEHGYRNPPT
ncbi:MAG: hypothetical protein SX243_21810 [Acidobacteriota bacterium]|nr:hypothetical protein [Acidobacteriota bacterium]